MPRQLGPGGGTQLPRHMGPPGPKIGGDPHACDTGLNRGFPGVTGYSV